MIVSGRDEPLVPFPALTDASGARLPADLWLRPFGLHEQDLGVDFVSMPRPLTVTGVLACCTRGMGAEPDEELLWNLPVGKRVEALLTIATAWDGATMTVALRCPEVSCGEELEVELTLDEIAEMQDQAYARRAIAVDIAGGAISLRRPTGIDQLDWLRGRYADESEAVTAMVRRLIAAVPAGGASLRPEMMEMIEEAMEELDPLVNFVATVRCFNCGAEHAHAIDLEDLALQRLRRSQLALLSTVHRLAGRYHWSEREIFDVPHWRRLHYLALIEREKR
jgi:hypothetical protein